MNIYINSEAFSKAINALMYRYTTGYLDALPYNEAISDVADVLAHFPPADVCEMRHGHWEKIGHIENTWLVSKCSECGYQTIDAGSYCTNCGAKMMNRDG